MNLWSLWDLRNLYEVVERALEVNLLELCAEATQVDLGGGLLLHGKEWVLEPFFGQLEPYLQLLVQQPIAVSTYCACFGTRFSPEPQ